VGGGGGGWVSRGRGLLFFFFSIFFFGEGGGLCLVRIRRQFWVEKERATVNLRCTIEGDLHGRHGQKITGFGRRSTTNLAGVLFVERPRRIPITVSARGDRAGLGCHQETAEGTGRFRPKQEHG